MTLPLVSRILLKKIRWSWRNIRKISTEDFVAEEITTHDTIVYDEYIPHIPAMVNEVIDNLNLKEGDLFLDMTFGAGKHSEALLEKVPKLRVIAIDRDPVTQKFADDLSKKYPNQITFMLGKFSELHTLLESISVKENSIDGVLFDLGCSSMQFDVAERGFSISKNGPLDMRMDGNRLPNQMTAADVIAHADEKDLKKIFSTYGGEENAKKIARAILQCRGVIEIDTTRKFSDLVKRACGDEKRTNKINRKAHVATKVFQALRIFVNNEINELNYGLLLAQNYLKYEGRAVAISFHSLENYIIRRHFKNFLVDNCKNHLPLIFFNSSKYYEQEELNIYNKKYWKIITEAEILPSIEEVTQNPRVRSAKLNAAIKIYDEQNK